MVLTPYYERRERLLRIAASVFAAKGSAMNTTRCWGEVRNLRPLVVLIASLSTASCTSWGHTTYNLRPARTRNAERLLVWTEGESLNLHTVEFSDSTLSGVPWWRSGSCEECRLTILLVNVDSIQLSKYSGSKTALAIGLPAVLGIYVGMLASLGAT